MNFKGRCLTAWIKRSETTLNLEISTLTDPLFRCHKISKFACFVPTGRSDSFSINNETPVRAKWHKWERETRCNFQYKNNNYAHYLMYISPRYYKHFKSKPKSGSDLSYNVAWSKNTKDWVSVLRASKDSGKWPIEEGFMKTLSQQLWRRKYPCRRF